VERRKIRDEQDARACLAAARAGVGTRAEWAREHGVDARSLNAWRVAIEKRVGPRRNSKGAKLVELVPTTAPAVSGRCVIDLGDARVEVDYRCSLETLVRVLQALRAC
jgi:hypothetical protein